MFNDLVGIVNYVLIKIGLISTIPMDDIPEHGDDHGHRSALEVHAFVVIAMLAILQAIPQEYDAARVDGATGWQQFWRITLPHIRRYSC